MLFLPVDEYNFIHVNAKVTTKAVIHRLLHLHFNPRHREGDDDSNNFLLNIHRHFNPRHREGDDSCLQYSDIYFGNFNPRHREGDDTAGNYTLTDITLISIHVTAKVTTLVLSDLMLSLKNFNPRHREGDDEDEMDDGYLVDISIHVTAKVTT